MKIGALQFFGWPDRQIPIADVYARALARVDVMEQSGFDAVWLAEHHFSGYSVCPNVHLMGMHVAGRTRRLRIGTAVTLPSLSHPLRVAEEVALLDVLSGGRVNWGAGRGFDAKEHRAFGISPEESYPKFREHFAAVLTAWREPRATFQGRFVSFEDVEVLPRPLQQPHPPVWVGASSLEAIEWAASCGHSILMDPHSTHAEIAGKRRRFDEVLASHGHPVAGRDIPIARQIALAASDGEARELALRSCAWLLGSYDRSGATGPIVSGNARATLRRGSLDDYVDGCVVWGSPARVRDELSRLQSELPLEYLMIAPLSETSFRLFVDEVLEKL
jgi:alkanesulfonate monooxygenase SsuD/methylene tetrahydromethanopterin reductase-like flavin-dependent oxidoreductase (luciferase family)